MSARGSSLAALALLGAACNSDLARDWSGRACRDSEPRCLSGYVCNAEGRCVTPGMLTSNGATGGDGGAGGAAGAPLPMGGAGGGAGAGLVPEPEPLVDAGGPLDAGAPEDAAAPLEQPRDAAVDGGQELDAGPAEDAAVDPPAPPDACTPGVLYQDSDGDGFGDPDVSVVACGASGWVEVAGDCRDDLFDVKPGAGFSGVGYADLDKPGGISFDYDCSGDEQPDPANAPNASAPTCLVALVLCSGAGYQPTGRSGSDVSSLCGSTAIVTCVSNGLLCSASAQSSMPAFRCR